MSLTIRRAEYFYTTVRDAPGESYQVLSALATCEVNLLAFSATPCGPSQAQLALFPEDTVLLARAAAKLGLTLAGPHRAFLVQGDDHLGMLAELHRRLHDARINVYASNGVTDGRGGFGYLIYVRSEDFEAAAHVLGV